MKSVQKSATLYVSTRFSMVTGSIHQPPQLSVHGLWTDISIKMNYNKAKKGMKRLMVSDGIDK